MRRMIKIIIGTLAVFAVIGIALYGGGYESDDESSKTDSRMENEKQADVVIPVKVSRPGCEETDSCYIPSKITVSVHQPVTWINQDAAFHSVTSGSYDSPTDNFDSGYMDPEQSFTLVFDRVGTVDYFCTLHPWMSGQVVVEKTV